MSQQRQPLAPTRVVPKIHPSNNKASQTEVNVTESSVLTVYKTTTTFDSTTNFSLDKYKNLDRSPNSKNLIVSRKWFAPLSDQLRCAILSFNTGKVVPTSLLTT